MELTYQKLIALVGIICAVWIIYVFYGVLREKAIWKYDFWRSKWKIALFWFIVAAVIAVGWYLIDKYQITI